MKNTTKSLFKSRFGKPPEPKPRAKMNSEPSPQVTQNSTFAISRPTLTRSDTFDKITPDVAQQQNVDIGINLTQNVITKLQEQTFTTASKPNRISLSPVALTHQFLAPRPIGDDKFRLVTTQISSTPFRDTPITKFSTRYLCDQKLLPPFDITGTDVAIASQVMDNFSPFLQNISEISEPSFLPIANLSPFDNAGSGSTDLDSNKQLNSKIEDNIADTTEPSFFAQCTPAVPIAQHPQEKFHILAENMREDNLIVDTTLNFCTSLAQNHDSIKSKTSGMNNTDQDESTIKSTTMLLCMNDESRHENTLVVLVPVDKEVMEIDDRGNMGSCGMFEIVLHILIFIYVQ